MKKWYWWVRIHRSCVKSDKDAETLTDLLLKYKGSFNIENNCFRNMWFDFDHKLCAIGFLNNLTGQLPYLKISMGNASE